MSALKKMLDEQKAEDTSTKVETKINTRPKLKLTPKRPDVSNKQNGTNTTFSVTPSLFNHGHTIIDEDVQQKRGILYLGPYECADENMLEQLQNKNIYAIVNCTQKTKCHHQIAKGFQYCHVDVVDAMNEPIETYFEGATEFIETHIAAGKNVLVHCRQGISRSSTIVIAYLMRYYNLSLDNAYITTKNRRPVISPNIGFWKKLLQYEKELNTLTSTNGERKEGTLSLDLPGKSKVFDACIKDDLADGHPAKGAGLGKGDRLIGTLIDNSWAKKSRFKFGMLKGLTDYTWFFPELRDLSNLETVVKLASTYIFANGFRELDIEWFIAVVNSIPSKLNAHNYVIHNILTDPTTINEDHFLSITIKNIKIKPATIKNINDLRNTLIIMVKKIKRQETDCETRTSMSDPPAIELELLVKCTSAGAIVSFIFLGSNPIFLGGVGGFVGLIGLCTFHCKRRKLATLWFACAASLHLIAAILGVTAIDYYLNHPGSEWGPSIFGDVVHGTWWWIVLSVLLSLINLMAGVVDMLMVRHKTCGSKVDLVDHFLNLETPGVSGEDQ